MTEKKNLKLIRLTANIDLIVNLLEDREDDVLVKEALVLIIDSNVEAMTQMLYMYPWLPTGVASDPTAEVPIKKSQIFYVIDVDEEIHDYFRNMWKAFIADEEDRKSKGETKKVSGENVVSINKNTPIH
jgi:hypothetical protein